MFHQTFRKEYSLDKRLNEVNKILQRYPDRLPILVSTSNSDTLGSIKLDKHKYLVPRDLTLLQFSHLLRNHIKCGKSEALFYLIGEEGILAKPNSTINELWYYHQSDDKYLLIVIQKENTFG